MNAVLIFHVITHIIDRTLLCQHKWCPMRTCDLIAARKLIDSIVTMQEWPDLVYT
jgi:hypothetical protein